MQNYPVGYQPYTQVQPMPSAMTGSNSGATFNISAGTPAGAAQNASGVTINIIGASVNPNGANIYNNNATAQAPSPANAYDKSYYTMPHLNMPNPSVPVAASTLNNAAGKTEEKHKKDIVLLTDDYIKTLENYIRNDNPDIKLMGAKELMNRFREDESRKNDPALTALLNLLLQSKYSNVKAVAMAILENGWAQGDGLTQRLLANIQQSNSGYGLDAIDAANAALKTAGQTVKVDDPNPPKKENKTKAKE